MTENQNFNQTGENQMDDTVTIKNAAKILGVPYATAYKWIIRQKRISHIDYGKSKAVLLQPLLEFKRAHIVIGNA